MLNTCNPVSFTDTSQPVIGLHVALLVKNLPANAGDTGDTGSIPWLGRFPRGGNGNPLQYSCLENSMDKGVWPATVHGITKCWTRLSDWTPQTVNNRKCRRIRTIMFKWQLPLEGRKGGGAAGSITCFPNGLVLLKKITHVKQKWQNVKTEENWVTGYTYGWYSIVCTFCMIETFHKKMEVEKGFLNEEKRICKKLIKSITWMRWKRKKKRGGEQQVSDRYFSFEPSGYTISEDIWIKCFSKH